MIIDRFEGEYAVVETDSGMKDIPVSELPADVREGDVIVPAESGYIVDRAETERLRSAAANRLKGLLNREYD